MTKPSEEEAQKFLDWFDQQGDLDEEALLEKAQKLFPKQVIDDFTESILSLVVSTQSNGDT